MNGLWENGNTCNDERSDSVLLFKGYVSWFVIPNVFLFSYVIYYNVVYKKQLNASLNEVLCDTDNYNTDNYNTDNSNIFSPRNKFNTTISPESPDE